MEPLAAEHIYHAGRKSVMAHKTSLPDLHIHLPAAMVDIIVFLLSFVVIAAVAGLAANVVRWS